MAYRVRFCNWLLFACFGLLFGARNAALAACDCTYGAYLRPNTGTTLYGYWAPDDPTFGSGGCQGSPAFTITGNGTVHCINSISVPCSATYPIYVRDSGNGFALLFTISQSQANSCFTNGVSSFTETNYTHCITWTNNTGVGRAYTFYQDSTGCAPGTYVTDSITGYIFAGGVISRCFTNKCRGTINLYVSPFQGAPRDEWVVPEDIITLNATNIWNNVNAVDGNTPGNGLGGGAQGFEPGNADPGAGIQATNISPVTNLVRVFNVAPTNGIAGNGATSQDIYNLGDALIRSGQQNTDRIIGAIRAGSTNGSGNADVVDAVRDFHRDTTNALEGIGAGISAVRSALGTNGILHKDLTNIDAALRGEGLGTNSFGDYGAALTGAGTAFGSAGYGTVTNAAGGYFGTGFTNGLGGSESGLLVDLAGSSSYPGSTLAKLDFRPSVWLSSVSVACTAVRAIISAFCVAVLFITIWRDMEERMRSLNSASQATGRSLAGASIIGSTVGLTIKTALSTIVTVGLAALPTAAAAVIGSSFSSSFLEIAQSAAGGNGAGTLGAKMGTVWQWLGLMFPFGVILTACLNFWAWKVFAFAFETLWHIVFRLLPAFLVFYYVVTVEARDWIIDNRLPESVAILAGMDEGDDVMWYKPGVHLAPGLLDNLTVAYGVGTSNHIAIEPENTAEWVRVIISETYGVPYTAYVRIQ